MRPGPRRMITGSGASGSAAVTDRRVVVVATGAEVVATGAAVVGITTGRGTVVGGAVVGGAVVGGTVVGGAAGAEGSVQKTTATHN